jgi:hypothetical protein
MSTDVYERISSQIANEFERSTCLSPWGRTGAIR